MWAYHCQHEMTKSINYNDRKSRFETFVNLLWLLTYPWKSKNQKDMYQTFILHKFHIEYFEVHRYKNLIDDHACIEYYK